MAQDDLAAYRQAADRLREEANRIMRQARLETEQKKRAEEQQRKPKAGDFVYYRTLSQEQAIHLGWTARMVAWGADINSQVIQYHPEDDTCDLRVHANLSLVLAGAGRVLNKIKRKSLDNALNSWYIVPNYY